MNMSGHSIEPVLQKLVLYLPARFRHGRLPYLFALVIILVISMGLVSLVTPYNGLPVPMIFAGVLVCLTVALSMGMPMHVVVHIGLLAALLQVTYAGWVSGGIFSPRLAWYTVIPLVPFYTISRRAGLFWLGAVLGMLCIMSGITWAGWLPSPTVGLAQVRSSFASNSVAMVLTISVVYLYDNLYRKAFSERLKRRTELEEKQQELIRTSALREQFLATVSHELRTPMNAILGFNVMLLGRAKNNPRALSILNHTRKSADHLMTVINDVLDHSQLQAGRLKVQKEVFDLHETVHNAFGLFKPRVTSMHLAYRCQIDEDVPRWINTDRHRLMQILVNLLGNAIKFTHQGHVTLHVQKHQDGVRFSVHDSGVGIADHHKARIFQRYVQADEAIQSRYGGTGLGLSITQRLVSLMGGSLDLESSLGKGSTFRFSLPSCAHEVPMPPSPDPAQPVLERDQALQFLVVDDHPINRLLVNRVLSKAWPNSRVVEAADGRQALTAMQQDRFDMVFMDMVMPNMDGIEATRSLRNELPEPACHTPVLGLTANVNPQDLERFKAAGLNDLMLKPFEPAQLCLQVEAWVTSRKSCPGS
jgi:signal transduction histidine kinase/CheY-like chemotaxis protein